ncbi:MAG: hypothetical protein K0R58_459 [Ramlibacter sp.]|nr:hypothetical protein [Ramlibacter sp.]
MRVPQPLLLSLFVALAASAYYLIFFTNAGNPYLGTYREVIFMDAVAVLAVFFGVEIIRTERVVPIRALAGALSFPLASVVVVTFGYRVYRYIAG